jgi:hypothetical protein
MKASIDKFYAENYDLLIEVSRKKISYFGRNIEPESLVSNSYLYLIGRKDLKEEANIPIWAINYINTELSFYNSQTMRRESVNVGDEKAPDIPYSQSIEEDVDRTLNIKGFKNTLDRLEQIVWEVYYEKGMRSSGDLSKHFKISRTDAWKYKRTILDKLMRYAESKKRL